MRTIDPAHVPAMIALEQTLYDYCAELDAGAARVTDYFTEDCVFHIGETVWHGHAGPEGTLRRGCRGGEGVLPGRPAHGAARPAQPSHPD